MVIFRLLTSLLLFSSAPIKAAEVSRFPVFEGCEAPVTELGFSQDGFHPLRSVAYRDAYNQTRVYVEGTFNGDLTPGDAEMAISTFAHFALNTVGRRRVLLQTLGLEPGSKLKGKEIREWLTALGSPLSAEAREALMLRLVNRNSSRRMALATALRTLLNSDPNQGQISESAAAPVEFIAAEKIPEDLLSVLKGGSQQIVFHLGSERLGVTFIPVGLPGYFITCQHAYDAVLRRLESLRRQGAEITGSTSAHLPGVGSVNVSVDIVQTGVAYNRGEIKPVDNFKDIVLVKIPELVAAVTPIPFGNFSVSPVVGQTLYSAEYPVHQWRFPFRSVRNDGLASPDYAIGELESMSEGMGNLVVKGMAAGLGTSGASVFDRSGRFVGMIWGSYDALRSGNPSESDRLAYEMGNLRIDPMRTYLIPAAKILQFVRPHLGP